MLKRQRCKFKTEHDNKTEKKLKQQQPIVAIATVTVAAAVNWISLFFILFLTKK